MDDASKISSETIEEIVCDICEEVVCQEKYIGCCSDGLCPNNVEFMCSICGTWDKKNEMWLCPDCEKFKR